jgi:hypothetical protein
MGIIQKLRTNSQIKKVARAQALEQLKCHSESTPSGTQRSLLQKLYKQRLAALKAFEEAMREPPIRRR